MRLQSRSRWPYLAGRRRGRRRPASRGRRPISRPAAFLMRVGSTTPSSSPPDVHLRPRAWWPRETTRKPSHSRPPQGSVQGRLPRCALPHETRPRPRTRWVSHLSSIPSSSECSVARRCHPAGCCCLSWFPRFSLGLHYSCPYSWFYNSTPFFDVSSLFVVKVLELLCPQLHQKLVCCLLNVWIWLCLAVFDHIYGLLYHVITSFYQDRKVIIKDFFSSLSSITYMWSDLIITRWNRIITLNLY
jgi:hypothetical protein